MRTRTTTQTNLIEFVGSPKSLSTESGAAVEPDVKQELQLSGVSFTYPKETLNSSE